VCFGRFLFADSGFFFPGCILLQIGWLHLFCTNVPISSSACKVSRELVDLFSYLDIRLVSIFFPVNSTLSHIGQLSSWFHFDPVLGQGETAKGEICFPARSGKTSVIPTILSS